MSPLRMVCEGCGRDVTASAAAVIHVSHSDVAGYEREQRQWEGHRIATRGDLATLLTPSELLAMPLEASWAVHCDGCNPHKDPDGSMCGNCYWFSLDRCQTAEQLLRWTAHLMGKAWLGSTDWPVLIERVLALQGATGGL